MKAKCEMEIEKLSSQIVRHLSLSGFHKGERIFNKVFKRYAKFSTSSSFRGDPLFRSTVSLHAPDIKDAPILDITEVVVYADEPKRNHALRIVASEWVSRTVKRQESIRNSGLDYCNWRDATYIKSPLFTSIFAPATDIVNVLREMSIEEGLECLAIIGAYWSYRFRPAGYIEYFRSTGWPILDSHHISDFIAQSSIMLIAMGWQAEYLVPIYWELIRKRKEAS